MVEPNSPISKILQDHFEQLQNERIARQNEPLEIPPIQNTNGDAFARCVSPSDALEAYKLSTRSLAISQLIRELRHDRVQAVCHEAIPFGEDGRERIHFAIVPTWVWWRAPPSEDADFWETGYLYTLIPANAGGTKIAGSVEFFGVRFWPDGLPGGADSAPSAESNEAQDKVTKASVSRADLARWHELFVQLYPDAPEALALRSAVAMFPDNHVPRQWVRELRGPQKRGKPANRQR